MVRCRFKAHLSALIEQFPDELDGTEIVESGTTDYRFRIFLPKKTWAVVLASLSLEMDYDNFKSECHKFQPQDDGGYVSTLHRVWNVMYSMQSREYGPGIYDHPKKVVGGPSLFDSESGEIATDTEIGGILVSEPEMDEDVIVVLDQDTGEEVVIVWWPELYDSEEAAYATAVQEGDASLVPHPEFKKCTWGECRNSATRIFDHAYVDLDCEEI